MTKLTGDVRAIESSLTNVDGVEKRTYKLNVKPATKAGNQYGYGNLNLVLHGAEMEQSGLTLGAKLDVYVVALGAEAPPVAEVESLRRELLQANARADAAEQQTQQYKDRMAREQRAQWDYNEKMRAMQQENVRLTVRVMALESAGAQAASGMLHNTQADSPQIVDGTPTA